MIIRVRKRKQGIEEVITTATVTATNGSENSLGFFV